MYKRQVLAGSWRRLRFRLVIARRQGLLRLADGHAPADPVTRLILGRDRLIDRRGRATEAGRAAAAATRREQTLWRQYRSDYPADAIADWEWSLAPIETVLPADLVAELERRVAAP